MKLYAVTLSSLLTLLALSCQAQTPPFSIFSGDLKVDGKLTFKQNTIEDAESYLGEPDDIQEEYWEMSELSMTVYIYDDNLSLKFNAENNRLLDIMITNDQHYLTLGDTNIRVGDHISVIKEAFPKSYSFKKNGVTAIGLGTGDHNYLLIKFDANGTITKLDTRTA